MATEIPFDHSYHVVANHRYARFEVLSTKTYFKYVLKAPYCPWSGSQSECEQWIAAHPFTDFVVVQFRPQTGYLLDTMPVASAHQDGTVVFTGTVTECLEYEAAFTPQQPEDEITLTNRYDIHCELIHPDDPAKKLPLTISRYSRAMVLRTLELLRTKPAQVDPMATDAKHTRLVKVEQITETRRLLSFGKQRY